MKKIKKYTALICASLLIFGNAYSAKATEDTPVVTASQEEIMDSNTDSTTENEPEYMQNIADIADNELEQEIIKDESDALQEEEQIDVFSGNYLSYSDTCISSNDIKEYTFKVDYSVTPDVKAAIVRTGDGDLRVSIKNDEGNQVLSFYCNGKNERTVINPKKWDTLNKPAGASEQCTFTATISTSTSSSFSFSIGNASDLPKMLSGDDKIVPVAKYEGHDQSGYTNYIAMRQYCPGSDCSDYYSYVATDRNIIELYSLRDDNMEFRVIDEETRESVYITNANDETIEKLSSTSNAYHVRYDGRDMVNGKKYLIRVYSRNGVSLEKSYNLYAGNPVFNIGMLKNEVSSTSSGTITSTRDTLFTFNVGGAPKGAYATKLYLYVGNATYRGEYSVISPNGKTYKAKHVGSGIYESYVDVPFDAINYDGGKNALANGTWMLSIRSPRGSYSIRPRISLDYKYMSGVEDIN